MLLPGADHTSDGVMARLERLERRMDVTGTPAPAAAPARPTPAPAPAPVQEEPAPEEPAPPPPVPTASPVQDGPPPPPPMPTSAPEPEPAAADPVPAAASAPDEQAAEQPAGPQGGLSLVDVRRLWPDILEQTKNRRRLAWMVLSQHAHVVDVDATRLTVGFANAGARDSFVNGGCDEILRQASIDVVGMDWRVESIVDPSGAAAQAPVVRQSATDATAPAVATPDQSAPDGPPDWVTGGAAPAAESPEPVRPPTEPPVSAAPAREALQAARAGGVAEPSAPVRSADDDVDRDDPDAESAALDTESLLSQTLGAKLIEEIKND